MSALDYSGLSYAFYTGDGSDTTFPTEFEFLDPEHVTVTVDGVVQTDPDDYSIVNSTVTFVTAPAANSEIRIVRVTPREYDDREVDFRAFGAITEDEMDLNQKQVWFLIQEAMETDDTGEVNPLAEYITWDSVSERWTAKRTGTAQPIGNVADPTLSDEAATKAYVDDIAEWGSAGIPQNWQFTSLNGTSNYTLSGGVRIDTNYLIVAVAGVLQTPNVDYIVIPGDPDSTLSFQVILPADEAINVQNFGRFRYINQTIVAPNSVATSGLQDDAVTTAKLATGAVTTPKLAADAVTNAKLADDAVELANIADSSVDLARLKATGFTAAPGGAYHKFLRVNKDTGNLEVAFVNPTDMSAWLTELGNVRINQLGAANSTISMGGNKILSVGTPTLSTDAATKGYIDGVIGSGVGAKIDLLYDTNLGEATQTWELFAAPQAWFQSSTYLFYEFVITNFMWTPGGFAPKIWPRVFQGVNNYEDVSFVGLHEAVRGNVFGTWSFRVNNPRDNGSKIGFVPSGGPTTTMVWNANGAGIPFGAIDKIVLRFETSNVTSGRLLVYGHRALS